MTSEINNSKESNNSKDSNISKNSNISKESQQYRIMTGTENIEILFTAEEISKLVQRLADQINEYYNESFRKSDDEATLKSEPILVVGILRGAFVFLADLIRKLTVPVDLEFIRTVSYGSSYISSGEIHLVAEPVLSPKNRRVLIVEDMIDTGRTLAFTRDYFLDHGAKEVDIAVLLDKTERREIEVPCRFIGTIVENRFLGGYGLDGGRYFAQCPEIFAVD